MGVDHGADLHHAYQAASVTEGAAQVYLAARQFGPVAELPEEEVRWIADLWRAQWTARTEGAEGAGG